MENLGNLLKYAFHVFRKSGLLLQMDKSMFVFSKVWLFVKFLDMIVNKSLQFQSLNGFFE